MKPWNRRDVLKLGILASTAAASPRWVAAAAEGGAERNVALNRAAWASSSADSINTGHMSTCGHAGAQWQSSDADFQWIYVDLGAVCKIHSVVLRWGANYPLAHTVQVSMESGPSLETGLVESWTDVHETLDGKGGVEEISLPETSARFVRLLLSQKANAGGYALSSFEVYGVGGYVAAPIPVPPPEPDGTIRLSGGWRLQSQAVVPDAAATVSACGYDDSQWLIATVPGTVLTSYLNLGAIPDPFYGDQQLQVSEIFAHLNWWYRNELELPSSYAGRRVWLNFGGINYRAYVYVNGQPAGNINGAFVRGRFDIAGLIEPGKKNCIAVLIKPVPKPDKITPKGLAGYTWPADFPANEPTFLEADGWDWLSSIRDRDTGIYNHVLLTSTGDVTIENPFATTHFPDPQNLRRADLTLQLELKNHSSLPCKGELKVRLGEVRFTHPVTLQGGETKQVKLDKSSFKQLSLVDPRLWWPNGHGDQNLYDLTLEFTCNGKQSDSSRSRIGIREFTYNQPSLTRWNTSKMLNTVGFETVENKQPLVIRCNGRRIFARGADWGMDEGMLRCDRDGFEKRLRFEKEMNLNILRNCAGNINKEEFFELCDQFGLMVWEEFGISNGIMPDDPAMWLVNARDRFLRRRNHACVVLWSAANESIPQEPILGAMPKMAESLDGTRLFLHLSTQTPPINGDGPYETVPPEYYFKELAHGFRPELGSPTFPTVECLRRMMPHNKLWPVNEVWGMHDWWLGKGWLHGVGLCGRTQAAIAAYGPPKGIEDFCRKAQMVNMEAYKAIFESWNDRMWNDCTGVLHWMSNPVWPSLEWNPYDYYMEPTATYFALRAACEPVHIQWNLATNLVKVANCTAGRLSGLDVEATIYNLDGSVFQTRSARVDSPADSVHDCLQLFAPGEDKTGNLSNVHFIKLVLKSGSGETLSRNFYWHNKTEWRYEELEGMKQCPITGSAGQVKDGKLIVNLENPSPGVALMIRLKLVDPDTGLLIAPVLYSDNYVSLAPHESRQIQIDLSAVRPACKAGLIAEGWNVPSIELASSIPV